jgi:phosphatidyl-myo-inositol dimannoside synthase
MHDPKESAIDNQYFPSDIFTGFNAAKTTFILNAVKEGKKADVVILSHINLLLAAWLIKKTNPHTQIILMAHGIEIWGTLSKQKKMMLAVCDKIVSVSNYTKNRIIAEQGIDVSKCFVLNNCIDPFLQRPTMKYRHIDLIKKYNLKTDDIVLLTLTRLSARDRYKGYDYVLDALVDIVKKHSTIKYILAGGYTDTEKIFIEEKIAKNNLMSNVMLTGYLPEVELANHFSMADIYIMPSIKEGFGIVFVEAMYYGVPVIAGNADGSVDALLNGAVGLLIETENKVAISEALNKMIENNSRYTPDDKLLMSNFGYEAYKKNLEAILA